MTPRIRGDGVDRQGGRQGAERSTACCLSVPVVAVRRRRRAPLQQQPKEEEEVAGSKPDSSSPLRPTSESAASRRASESDPSLLLPLRHLNANPLVLGYLTQVRRRTAATD